MEANSHLMSMIYELKNKCVQVDLKLMEDLKISQSELLFFSSLSNCQVISSPELAKHRAYRFRGSVVWSISWL